MVNDLPTLAWAANLGTIEFHVPLWHVGRHRKIPANPDFMVFDLDPGEGASIVECCVVAEWVIDELAKEGSTPSPRRAAQRVFSCTRRSDQNHWDALRHQALDLARKLESEHPDLIVSNMRKSLQPHRVLIDWSQNHPAKTTIGVYSVRARSIPMVSTPVTLAEVRTCAKKRDTTLLRFTTDEVLRRVQTHGDLSNPLALH